MDSELDPWPCPLPPSHTHTHTIQRGEGQKNGKQPKGDTWDILRAPATAQQSPEDTGETGGWEEGVLL